VCGVFVLRRCHNGESVDRMVVSSFRASAKR